MSKISATGQSHVHDNCRCDYSYLRKKGPKFQAQTTNHAYYKPYPIQKQQTVFQPPKPTVKHYDPDSLKTSYKVQYVKPQMTYNDHGSLAASKMLAQSYHAKKAKVPLATQTQYKKNFEPKQVKIQKQPVYQYKPREVKFQGETSYKQQYTPKANMDLSNVNNEIVSAQKAYQQRPKVKFQGQSSYKATYQKHDLKPQHGYQPEYKYQPKNVKFQGQSSYKATYTKLPQSAYKSQLQHCPVHPDRVAIK